MSLKVLSKGEQTRERLLDLAEDAVLAKGFAATSIDELIAAANITKSGFFYHFCDKNDLAVSLMRRFLERDDAIYRDLTQKAAALADDPLQEFLIFLKLLADTFADLPNGHPGCLAAACAYQEHMFDQEVRDLTAQSVQIWHRRYRATLDRIAEKYPPKVAVDLDALAHMVSAIADGGIILSKSLHDPSLLPQQILAYRNLVRAVFLGA